MKASDDTTIRIDLLRHSPETLEDVFSDHRRLIRNTEGISSKRMQLTLHLASMPDAVVISSPEGLINDMNAPAASFFGLSIEHGLHRKLEDFLPGMTPEILSQILMALRDGRLAVIEGMAQTVGGVGIPVEVSVSLCGGHGEELCFIVHDIQHHQETELTLNQVQQRIAKAERLEAAGTVSGQIAHDFNNLLTPMLAYPSLIRRELVDGSPALEYLRVLEKTAEDMAHMTQQLLALSRRGSIGEELFCVNDVIQHVFSLMSNDPPPDNVELAAELADDLLLVRGGSDQMLRVVQNLCQNAIDAMDEGGLLHVQTENVYLEAPVGRYDTVEPGEYVRIAIRDSGPGIHEDIRDKVFEPFFTTKRGNKRRGSGLGLSIVHGIIRDHKGYVDMESVIGKGTTFYLYLPVCRGEQVATSVDAEQFGQGEKILVIDDDPDQLHVVVQLLQVLHYQAEGVHSGESALDWLETHSGECDLVIVDMCLEDGMDGCDTWCAIAERYPMMASIMVSGFLQPLVRLEEAQSKGAGAYVKKPLTLANLGRAIRHELSLHGTGAYELPEALPGFDVAASGAEAVAPCARVLLVDDEESIRRMFAMVLDADIPGLRVLQAGNGKEAIDLFQETPCDIIIMDLHMPIMDGRQAFIRLRDYCQSRAIAMPPVIFCTGFALPDFLKEVVDGKGLHTLLRKPVRPDVLVKTVQDRLPAS